MGRFHLASIPCAPTKKQLSLSVWEMSLSLYTRTVEARSQTGELFGFERLNALFAVKANAEQAADAAMTFGQDDDITVLTVTRLECDAASAAQYTNSTPAQAPRQAMDV